MGKVDREQYRNDFLAAARVPNALPIGVTSLSQLEKSFMLAVRDCTTPQHVQEICDAMAVLEERIPTQQIVAVPPPLSADFKYRSTPDGSPPSGRRRKGTFRNLSFLGMKPENIDQIDFECQQQGISRFEWMDKALESEEGRRRIHALAEGIRLTVFRSVWERVDREIKAELHAESPLPT